jgi:5-methyltetrahydropteroyltriglutamate--homocysteine methyltransferase
MLPTFSTLSPRGTPSLVFPTWTLLSVSADHILHTLVIVSDIFLSPSSAMGRGRQQLDKGIDLHAMEMKKWFDSNYHFVVPEISPSTNFKLNYNKYLEEYKEAKELGITTRPVVLGPVTFLALSKAARDAPAGYEPLSALDQLLPVYVELLTQLKEAGVEHVQLDEPILVQDRAESLGAEFAKAYKALSEVAPKITIATYFGRLGKSIDFVKDLPIYAVHIDLDRAAGQFEEVLSAVKSTKLVLSLGLVSGRAVWKTDLKAAQVQAEKAISELGKERVIIATSSSLLHTPVTLASESRLTPEQTAWFSFALEKCEEVAVLAKALNGDVTAAFEQNTKDIAARREFERTSDSAVRDRLSAVTDKDLQRPSPFPERRAAQDKALNLPQFPTTTIGSFPQTKEIRVARAQFNKGTLSKEDYEKAMEKEVETVVRFQEKCGLDVLVHGEPERNDMVQYFGEQLNGFVFTQMGWVQSYGSRYVRPPIIVSDVSRSEPMTVRWSSYAASLTKNPMKGMLTGPVTILNWSFNRADVSREVQCKQLALALRDEVKDLETAGIQVIQVDEPAIREGLPLRQVDWANYLKWAVDSFRLSTACANNETQIHSHFCKFINSLRHQWISFRSRPRPEANTTFTSGYSDFADIFQSIKDLDTDVISIEVSELVIKRCWVRH